MIKKDELKCYIVPSLPLPILLPIECVAEVVVDPTIKQLEKVQVSWMKGHSEWRNQRLPVLSYSTLLNNDLSQSALQAKQKTEYLIVLNAIPGAARKTYSALHGYGKVKQVSVNSSIDYVEPSKDIDKRYVEAVMRFNKKDYIVPKLASLAVAFTYI